MADLDSLGRDEGLRRVRSPAPKPGDPARWGLREQFPPSWPSRRAAATYRRQLESRCSTSRRCRQRAEKTVGQIEAALEVVHRALDREDWTLHEVQIDKLDGKLIDLQRLTSELPSHLYSRFRGFAAAERSEYRTLIIGTWIAAALAAMIFGLFINLFYQWIFRPLRILIEGSRFVAAGQFSYHSPPQRRRWRVGRGIEQHDAAVPGHPRRPSTARSASGPARWSAASGWRASVSGRGGRPRINNPLASIAMRRVARRPAGGAGLDGGEPDPLTRKYSR